MKFTKIRIRKAISP